jgi:hypothetical protein
MMAIYSASYSLILRGSWTRRSSNPSPRSCNVEGGVTALTITLSPEQERLLAEAVAAGLAKTPDEAIDDEAIDKAVRA